MIMPDTKINKLNQSLHFLILLPLFWSFTGLFLYPNGKKIIVPLVLIAALCSLITFKLKPLKFNLKYNKLLWLLGAYSICSIAAYFFYGFSSSQLRGVLSLFVYISIFPVFLLSKNILKILTTLGVITSLLYILIQTQYYGNYGRMWTINPIPYATFVAAMSILSLNFFFQSQQFKERALWLILFSSSLIPLFLSQSRGVWLAIILTTMMLIIKNILNNRKNVFLIIPLLLIIIPPAYNNVDKIEQRIAQTTAEIKKITENNLNSSIGLRLQMWKAARLLAQKSPIIGLGNEHLTYKKELVRQGAISKEAARFTHYHNQFINDYIKYGLIGLSLLLYALILPIAYFFKGNNNDRWAGVLVVSIFALAALTDVPFQHSQTFIIYILIIHITLFSPKLMTLSLRDKQ